MPTTMYQSPIGDLELTADARGLTSLRFVDAVDEARGRAADAAAALALEGLISGSDALSGSNAMAADAPEDAAAAAVLARAWAWLNAYFAGQAPCWLPPLHMPETPLEHAVWVGALRVPAGDAVELSSFARRVAERPGVFGDGAVSGADALECAVARALAACPIAIMVPCHRIEGAPVSMAAQLRAFEQGFHRA